MMMCTLTKEQLISPVAARYLLLGHTTMQILQFHMQEQESILLDGLGKSVLFSPDTAIIYILLSSGAAYSAFRSISTI